MKSQKPRKAELEAKYLRVIEVCKKDPDITNKQLEERFGIGIRKIRELRGQAQ